MEFISQFTIADLVVLVTLAGGVLVGFQHGLLRYILNCVVVLVAFVLASILKGPIADTLGSVWDLGTPEQQELWIYLFLFAVGVIGGFFLVRRAVTQVEEEVVARRDALLDLPHGRLFIEHGQVPLGLRQERPRVTRPVVVRQRAPVEVLRREQTNAHLLAAGYHGRSRRSTVCVVTFGRSAGRRGNARG